MMRHSAPVLAHTTHLPSSHVTELRLHHDYNHFYDVCYSPKVPNPLPSLLPPLRYA